VANKSQRYHWALRLISATRQEEEEALLGNNNYTPWNAMHNKLYPETVTYICMTSCSSGN